MKKYVSANALRASLFTALLVCAVSSVATAQTLPSPWTVSNVGTPAQAGSSTYASGVFTVAGGGTDIWGTSDQFRFVYQQVSGDVDVIARIDDLLEADPYSKAGVMIRASLSANSAHASSFVFGASGVWYNRRTANGGTTTTTAGTTTGAPMWLRAKRVASRVTTYYSTNGTSWTTIGYDTIALGTSAYVGLAVTSHSATTTATAKFSSVTVAGSSTATAPPPTGTLPSGQQSGDLGAPSLKGTVAYASGAYTVKAGGTDIWNAADQGYLVYQPMSGDGQVVARVASITNTHVWAKGGVMIRESLTADARNAFMLVSYGSGNSFQRRADAGGVSVSTSGGTGTAPGWVKLVRAGDLFTAYRSTNGTTWTTVGSDTIPMADTVYVGLAATSHNSASQTSVVFDNFKVTAGVPTTNQSPAVSVTGPANGTTVTLPTTVTVTASASDPENRMASVEFYAGSTLVGTDTTAPYSVTWAPSAVGTFALTARAHDADGGSSTSSAVNVTVNSATNKAPTVSLATNGTSFAAPATITLTATASDPEGKMARVEFFNGATRLTSDTAAPYTYSMTNVAAGTYKLTAVAYDTAGASATTAAVTVTVTAVASTAPKSVVFNASADHTTNVTSYMLKVFAAGANTSTGTPAASSDLGKPAPDSTNTITVDRATFFNGLATGNYVATVTAIGPGGQTQSSSVTFTR